MAKVKIVSVDLDLSDKKNITGELIYSEKHICDYHIMQSNLIDVKLSNNIKDSAGIYQLNDETKKYIMNNPIENIKHSNTYKYLLLQQDNLYDCIMNLIGYVDMSICINNDNKKLEQLVEFNELRLMTVEIGDNKLSSDIFMPLVELVERKNTFDISDFSAENIKKLKTFYADLESAFVDIIRKIILFIETIFDEIKHNNKTK